MGFFYMKHNMLALSLEFNKYPLPINRLVFFVGIYTTGFYFYREKLTLFILLGPLLLLLLLYLDYLCFQCTLLRDIVLFGFVTYLILVSQCYEGDFCIYICFYLSVCMFAYTCVSICVCLYKIPNFYGLASFQ